MQTQIKAYYSVNVLSGYQLKINWWSAYHPIMEEKLKERWKDPCWRNTGSCSLWWFCSGTHRLPSGHLIRCHHCRAGTSPWRCQAVSETLETFCSQDHREEKWGKCHYAHRYSTQQTLFVYVNNTILNCSHMKHSNEHTHTSDILPFSCISLKLFTGCNEFLLTHTHRLVLE